MIVQFVSYFREQREIERNKRYCVQGSRTSIEMPSSCWAIGQVRAFAQRWPASCEAACAVQFPSFSGGLTTRTP